MNDIFISYVYSNEEKVRRLYEDLSRAGFKVWEFRTSVKYDEDFVVEFKKQILDSRVFILIDSSLSRLGEYVRVEVAYARENKKDLTVCRMEETIVEQPLYTGQDRIIGFNMWDSVYHLGIRALCEHLGKEYIPFFTEPIDEDFLEEMGGIKMKEKKFNTLDWRSLVKTYEAFREAQISGAQSPFIDLQYLIMVSKRLGNPLLTPYLVLGDLYARRVEHLEAKRVYSEAAADFPGDPRTHAGLGGATFYLSDFKASAHAYSVCFDLLLKTDKEKHQQYLPMIAHNLFQSCLQAGLSEDFIMRLNSIPRFSAYWPQLDVLRGKYFLYKMQPKLALNPFEKAYRWFSLQQEIPSQADAKYRCILIIELAMAYGYDERYQKRKQLLTESISLIEEKWGQILDDGLRSNLAEMMRLLGETYINGFREISPAIRYYEKACLVAPALKFYAELALVYYRYLPLGLQRAIDDGHAFRLKIDKLNSIDKYYAGLLFFLDGNIGAATGYYKDSRMTQWPFYQELIDA